MLLEFVHVMREKGREVGVGGRRVGSTEEPELVRNSMRRRHVVEPDGRSDPGDSLLQPSVAVRVHQCDRDRPRTFRPRVFERASKGFLVEYMQDLPICGHTGVDLDHPIGKDRGLLDVESKQIGTRLIADPREVSKPPIRDEHTRTTLSL